MQNEQRRNSEVFIDLFTEIEQKLKEICKDTYHTSFSELIQRAYNLNPTVKQYINDLREYSQLRNAITHNRRENFIIAEPHDDVVKEIRHIRNMLYNPPKVSSIMQDKPFCASPNTSILEVLDAFATKGFMRCPILDGNRIVGLVTSKTLARWIISKPQNIQNDKIESLIPFTDPNDYSIVGVNTDIISLVGQFKSGIQKGNYLQAILVTKSGKPEGPLVGIITPSDLPKLMEIL
jgi:predicted transcriptional regulator